MKSIQLEIRSCFTELKLPGICNGVAFLFCQKNCFDYRGIKWRVRTWWRFDEKYLRLSSVTWHSCMSGLLHSQSAWTTMDESFIQPSRVTSDGMRLSRPACANMISCETHTTISWISSGHFFTCTKTKKLSHPYRIPLYSFEFPCKPLNYLNKTGTGPSIVLYSVIHLT